LTVRRKKKWQDEEKYEATDWFPGAKDARMRRLNNRPKIFISRIFYLGPSTKMSKNELSDIISSAGGQITSILHTSNYCISGDRPSRKVLELENDKEIKNKAHVVKEEWVYDSLVEGKRKDPKDYQIDYAAIEEENKKVKEERFKLKLKKQKQRRKGKGKKRR